MNTFLDTVPDGMLVLIGVADEAGLDDFPGSFSPPNPCHGLGTSCLSGTLQRLATLRSQQIGSYCYQSSWAFASVKGESLARAEGVGSAVETQARTTLPMITRTLTTSITGSGSIDAVPAGVRCGANCTTFPVNTNTMLYAVPGNGWIFSSWSGGCSGSATPCSVGMDADRNVTATFILAATRLAITSITPASPTAGSAFSVTVQAQDTNGNAANVAASTAVQLSRTSGTGSLGGTTSGSITAGTNAVTIAGVTYTRAESGVVVTATRTSGDVLGSGDSPPFSVLPHPGLSLYTVTPCRVLDTRNTSPLPNLTTRDVQISGVCGIPNSAAAVAANITAVAPDGVGFLALYPTGSTWPGNSTINYNTGKTRANNAILTLSAGGATTVFNNGSTQHFIIDVMGYFQ